MDDRGEGSAALSMYVNVGVFVGWAAVIRRFKVGNRRAHGAKD